MKTGMTPHRVAIVVDEDFALSLKELADRVHVWLVDTPANRSAARRLWAESGGAYSFERGVTTFKVRPSDTPEERAAGILAAIEEHHGEERHDPPCRRIEVFGARPEPAVRAEFGAYGYTEIVATSTGFVACKR